MNSVNNWSRILYRYYLCKLYTLYYILYVLSLYLFQHLYTSRIVIHYLSRVILKQAGTPGQTPGRRRG